MRRFLERGYRVYVLDIDEKELKHTTEVHLKQYFDKGMVQSAVCNLQSVDEIRNNVRAAADWLGGRIEVLVNNGGIAHPYWKEYKTMADFDTIKQWQAYAYRNQSVTCSC